jgi:hypothetical protein
MKKEVGDSLFGARLFYIVFHSLGIIILMKYENPLKKNW